MTPQPPPSDGKWRFFWRIGELEAEDEKLLAPQVIPEDYPQWEEKMDYWGEGMYNAVRTASEAIAVGLDIKRDSFTRMMDGGVQLLAPTGSDLEKYNQKNDILAGFHYGKISSIFDPNSDIFRPQLHHYSRKEQIPRFVHLAQKRREETSQNSRWMSPHPSC